MGLATLTALPALPPRLTALPSASTLAPARSAVARARLPPPSPARTLWPSTRCTTPTGKIGSGKGQAATAITGSNTLALYKVHNTNGYKPVVVTESASNVNYQYVSQCSNRGACDGSTGLCSC